jgi:hypothetical protein
MEGFDRLITAFLPTALFPSGLGPVCNETPTTAAMASNVAAPIVPSVFIADPSLKSYVCSAFNRFSIYLVNGRDESLQREGS